jgi:hypothetical protein
VLASLGRLFRRGQCAWAASPKTPVAVSSERRLARRATGVCPRSSGKVDPHGSTGAEVSGTRALTRDEVDRKAYDRRRCDQDTGELGRSGPRRTCRVLEGPAPVIDGTHNFLGRRVVRHPLRAPVPALRVPVLRQPGVAASSVSQARCGGPGERRRGAARARGRLREHRDPNGTGERNADASKSARTHLHCRNACEPVLIARMPM